MRFFVLLVSFFLTLSASAQLTLAERTRLKSRTDAYKDSCESKSDWLLSRLQMYWRTCASDVFVHGETFSHPGGERAKWPTVKYNGSRSMATDYDRPPLDKLLPYDDDEQGSVTFINKKSRMMEKTHPSKTGCNIASINRQIMGVARDAARLYKDSGDESYALMAFGVFDTFLKGIFCRNIP